MVHELISWLQTDMAAVDDSHLAAALSHVAPQPPSDAEEEKGAEVGGERDQLQSTLNDIKV